MACNCETYQCLSVDYDPCSQGLELPLIADETGTWTMLIEFNGTWNRLNVEVVDGGNIVIPNVVNEYYVHTIRLLNTEKELFNDTCYKIITQTVSGENIPVPGGGSGSETFVIDFTTQPAISEYQDDRLIGAEILLVMLEQNVFTNYTFDSTTGTIVTPLLLPGGGLMKVLYKK